MKTFRKIFILTIIFSALISTSCNRKQKIVNEQKNNYNTVDTLITDKENPVLTEFRAYVNSLDSTDATSALQATEKYKIIFAGKSQGLCDTAFVIFQNLIDTLIVTLNDKLDNDTTDYEAFINGEIITPKVADFRKYLTKNGFSLKSSEGIVYIDLNYDFIIQNFSSYVSEPMNAYLIEIQTENKEGFAQDGIIIISPQKLVDRIIWYENFISQYPGFIMIENCKNYRKAYFTYLLSGYNNTPLFSDNETKELSSYFKTAYDYLLKKYTQSETAVLTQPYYDAIKQNQPSAANDILKKYMIKGLIYNLK